jgi:hypothetical protein
VRVVLQPLVPDLVEADERGDSAAEAELLYPYLERAVSVAPRVSQASTSLPVNDPPFTLEPGVCRAKAPSAPIGAEDHTGGSVEVWIAGIAQAARIGGIGVHA